MSEKASGANKALTAEQRAWLDHLNRCEAQRCSSVSYAREHGLSIAALYAARKDLRQRGAFRPARVSATRPSQEPVTLVPVQLRSPATSGPCVLRVVLPNGVVIEVPEQAEPGRCQALAVALSGMAR